MSKRNLGEQEIRIDYDEEADILYLTIGAPIPARTEEEEPGVVWRYDMTHGNTIGVTVQDFKAYWYPKLDELAAHMARHFHWKRAEAEQVLEHVE